MYDIKFLYIIALISFFLISILSQMREINVLIRNIL